MKTKKILVSALASVIGISSAAMPFEMVSLSLCHFTAFANDNETAAEISDPAQETTEAPTETAAVMLGDVNGDTSIDASDASLILIEYAAASTGKESTLNDIYRISADVDENDIIDASDASLILRFYAYNATGGELGINDYLEYIKNNPEPVVTTAAETTAAVSENTKTTAVTEADKTTTASQTTESAKTTSVGIKVTDITLSRYEAIFQVGESSRAAVVTMYPQNAPNIKGKWSSSDESIATVNQDGLVTAKKTGTCVITVQSVDNDSVSAQIIITVEDPVHVSDINLSQTEMSIEAGNSALAANVTMMPATAKNKAEKWTSSDESVATVNKEGYITAKKAGKAVITVSSVDNPKVFASVHLTVTGKSASPGEDDPKQGEVTGIGLSKTKMEISVGKSDIAIVTMYPESASDKSEKWTTSDPKIATVDEYGWVYGVSPGKCTITVSSVDSPSIKAEIKVTVVKSGAAVEYPDFSSIVPGKSTQNQIAFMTPIPENAKGKFNIKYIITDANGKKTTITSAAFTAPAVQTSISMLTAGTNEFTATSYLVNTATGKTAYIGDYSFALSPRDARIISENISGAFLALDALT